VKTVEAALDAGYGIFAGARAQWATLVFSAEAARWVSREEWHPRQKSRHLPDGRFELKVPYANETELVMDVLRHGGEVAVVAPDSLREAVQAQLRAALRSHAAA
jgi:predicted DNA-binding transcriptional regulator YafY